jgi:hypothetical protein
MDQISSKGRRVPVNRLALVLAVLLLAVLLGAWRDLTGNTINPRYVERLKDGQTTIHEIKLWFGEPQEVERTAEGAIFKYFSYKDAGSLPSKAEREPQVTSEHLSHPFMIDKDKTIKRVPVKKDGKILRSTLTIRFKPNGETMMSHEYQEF